MCVISFDLLEKSVIIIDALILYRIHILEQIVLCHVYNYFNN